MNVTGNINGQGTISVDSDIVRRTSATSGRYVLQNTAIEKGTIPESYYYWDWASVDSSGLNAINRAGTMTVQVGTDGSTGVLLRAYRWQKDVNAYNTLGVYTLADGTAKTYAPTPRADADGNTIATTGWSDGRYLKLTGGSISGTLNVDGWMQVEKEEPGLFLRIQNKSLARGETPDSDNYIHLSVYDKNGFTNASNRFTAINTKVDTKGTVAHQLIAYQNIAGSTPKSANLQVCIEKDGKMYAWGPTPPAESGGNIIPTIGWLDSYSQTLSRNGVKALGGADYNLLTDSGFYHVNAGGTTNGPGEARKLIVLQNKQTPSVYITQLALPIAHGTCPSIRVMDGQGDWQPWQNLLLAQSNETITANAINLSASALITYPGNTTSQVPNYAFSIDNYEKGDAPDKTISARYYLYDKNGGGLAKNALSGVLVGVQPNKQTYAKLVALNNTKDATDSANISVYYNADGSKTTDAPPPSDTANGDQIATAGWTRKYGGYAWGLGRSAIPLSSTEFSDGDVNGINKCGFYGLSASKNALWNTATLLHIERPWTAGPTKTQLNFGTGGQIAVRSFDDNTTWSAWKKLATENFVNDGFLKLSGGTVTGTIKAKSFQATSDARLKHNKSEIDVDLSDVKPMRYTFADSSKQYVGLIAQDVEKVLPEAVSVDEDGFKSVDYNAVVAALVGEVNRLKIRLARLENKA